MRATEPAPHEHADDHADDHDRGRDDGRDDGRGRRAARARGRAGGRARGHAHEHPIAHAIAEEAHAIAEEVKPHLRGWLHAVAFPLAVAGGIALVVSARTLRERIGLAVFTVTAAQLLGTSATFHRGSWSPGTARLLNRLDHVGIFFIIAGSYTAFALTVLPDPGSLLVIVWLGALAGATAKMFWLHAPRWMTTGAYLALGWVAVFYLEPLYRYGGPVVLGLIVAGGLLYTIGAVVYGTRRPNPSPRWFGFHEVFHAFTLLALTAHGVAAYLAIGTIG